VNTSELASEFPKSHQSSRRVVEAEFRLPKLDEIRLPQIDLEPVRAVVEDALLTGIGAGVLAARGLTGAVKAAHQAGADVAQRPGSFAKALLSLVRKPEEAAQPGPSETAARVPVLPIDNYDQLVVVDLIERLAHLSAEQLGLLRGYESDHQARVEVLEAIDQQLAESEPDDRATANPG